VTLLLTRAIPSLFFGFASGEAACAISQVQARLRELGRAPARSRYKGRIHRRLGPPRGEPS
jgi:hypothetical protein